ncbi:DUF3606 domain-containing protein [Allosphingosinicella deserti]|uniref:DUF3606 domain-containing protein n=1 Tax=Allosphingosinicella deserti TaxID=2116704 RepID=A0A2P7QZT3_9SPHN|nr:DUF3606 domain-containing protein [Sphingomonas deserti]PSJ43477.1 DUF3606 domain-containing protein [Sphingomonas deserti]
MGCPDRNRISLSEDHEIRDWAKLREAVAAGGNSADKAREYRKG